MTNATASISREVTLEAIPIPAQSSARSSRSVVLPSQHSRRQRRQEVRQRRREARRQRRLEARRRRGDVRRRNQRVEFGNNGGGHRSSLSLTGLYQSVCHVVSVLTLPLIVILAVIGVILFGIFFCLPLLLFMLSLLCMYYCCTEEPVPPRALWRALMAESNSSAPPPAPVTPAGITVKQVQELIIMRELTNIQTGPSIEKFTESENDLSARLGTDVLVQQDSNGPVYWPIKGDNEDGKTTYYIFSNPLSSEDILTIQNAGDDGEVNPATAEPQDEAKQEIESDDLDDDMDDYLEPDSDPGVLQNISPFDEVDWTCPCCTLVNDYQTGYCAACVAPRPQIRSVIRQTTMDMPCDAQNAAKATDESAMHAPGTGHVPHDALCDICLGDYETGDFVAWSKNTRCKHAYHIECISDWLIRRPTCPSCRQVYIDIPETMKSRGRENSRRLHQDQPAVDLSSSFRMQSINDVARQFPSDDYSSGSESIQDSVNQAVMFDDTEESSVEWGDNNV